MDKANNNTNININNKKKRSKKAGDGFDLIPTREDGTPALRDKYGNLVTENTGKGKGIMLKNYYNIANKNISAPSPEDFVKVFSKPRLTINTMSIEYVYTSILDYYNSIIEPIYDRIPKLDDNDEPILDSNNKTVYITKLIDYKYKNVPSTYGLAASLGITRKSIFEYINIDTNSNSDISNRDNKYIDFNLIKSDISNNILYKIYKEDIFKFENSKITEKTIKGDILKKAWNEIFRFHEQRLGVNENVSGSIFALLNSRDDWTNEHKVTVDIPQLLGNIKSPAELDKMADNEKVIDAVLENTFELPEDF